MICQMKTELYKTNVIKLLDSGSGEQVKDIPVYKNDKKNLFYIGKPIVSGYKIMSQRK